MRFTTFRYRTMLYRTRPKLKGVEVRLDLTKSLYDLLSNANNYVKVALVSLSVFISNLLVWSHYCNFIKEFYNLFYLSKLVENDTKGRYILCFKTCDQIEIKNQKVSFFTKCSIVLNVVILRQILYVDSHPQLFVIGI